MSLTAAVAAAAPATNNDTSVWITAGAGLLGVVLGGLITGFAEWFRWKVGAKDRRENAEWDRVLEFLHVSGLLGSAANGLAFIYAERAAGRPTRTSHELKFTDEFNTSSSQLTRHRLEIAIRGPEWVQGLALDVENASRALNGALWAIRASATRPTLNDYRAKMKAYNDARTAFNKKAIEQSGK